MNRVVEQVTFNRMPIFKLKKVVAYARVSSSKDEMLHSIAAQVMYYTEYIKSNNSWKYCGIYADEGITGTKETRPEFQRMLNDCRDGKIDMIITKSISRFARNTVTLLETVRELKDLHVDVYFEEQQLHSNSSEGELMLTLLASYAQEESLSVSENMKWRIKKNFESGIPWNINLLGYRFKDGQFQIEESEAEIVRRIFAEYLSGKGMLKIAKELTNDGIPTKFGEPWVKNTIQKILKNYTYTGNLLLQKTFRENHITKKEKINKGELPMYHVSNTHEPIIDIDTYNQVQALIEKRANKYYKENSNGPYRYTGLIVCDKCGKKYKSKARGEKIRWICDTYNNMGKSYCASKQIPEEALDELFPDIDSIKKIIAKDGNTLEVHYTDGRIETKLWKDRSRADSWTDEMKAVARQKAKQYNNISKRRIS